MHNVFGGDSLKPALGVTQAMTTSVPTGAARTAISARWKISPTASCAGDTFRENDHDLKYSPQDDGNDVHVFHAFIFLN
jgi:hypothetical protein